MNMFLNKLVALLMTILSFMPWNLFSAKSNAKDFRVVTYVVGNGFVNAEGIDDSHFSQVTDVIYFGMAWFNENGEIELSENFETALTNLRNAIGDNDVRLHLNLIGPGGENYQSLHSKAFKSGALEGNILDTLKEYEFDGVCFDYEYPYTEEDWAAFDEFLISLDSVLGDDYILGCAISAWNSGLSKEAIKVLDMVEVMAYDIFDDDGTHSSIELTKCCVIQMLLNGYKKEQMDLGLPFYGRPVNKEAYWYGYGPYTNEIDEKGLVYIPERDLTFSYNTYDVIYEKTTWAIRFGMGGVMAWHYACDAPASDEKSLFNAVYNAKTDMIE